MKTPVELLAPARNLNIGIEAVNHGADAVYIGAENYGARAAAVNTTGNIEKLVQYAHKYRAKVYVALNTILYDNEIEPAIKLAWNLYHAGVDAFIIQDMGLIEAGMPPVALHASTQCYNVSPEKILFLENVGFKRVVLARELHITEIETIRAVTHLELEFFIHGALCVSYSGQCFMSHAVTGRSGNRGECCQACRSEYSLTDEKGKMLVKNKHLLSLADLDQSENLELLLNAGITSLKIEGRLKDMEYVKNITAYYRQKLDALFSNSDKYKKSSSGKSTIFFEPDPQKTFSRFSTQYFLLRRNKTISSMNTQKSVGEEIGKVVHSCPGIFAVETKIKLNSGDGICFFDQNQRLTGIRINKIKGRYCHLQAPVLIPVGSIIYRNYDLAFSKQLSQKSAERRIAVELIFTGTDKGFSLQALDEDGIDAVVTADAHKNPAENPEIMKENIITQLSKSGDTIFNIAKITDSTEGKYFMAVSLLNKLRRDALSDLEEKRLLAGKAVLTEIKPTSHPFPESEKNIQLNISNQFARKFYQRHGINKPQKAFELLNKKEQTGKKLMTMRYCIRYQNGWCEGGPKDSNAADLFLLNFNRRYKLRFDCKNCRMELYNENPDNL